MNTRRWVQLSAMAVFLGSACPDAVAVFLIQNHPPTGARAPMAGKLYWIQIVTSVIGVKA